MLFYTTAGAVGAIAENGPPAGCAGWTPPRVRLL